MSSAKIDNDVNFFASRMRETDQIAASSFPRV
jgi:hypothetical protein